jgi:hypothetical protein
MFDDDSDLEEVAGEVIDLVDREDIPIPEPPKEDNSIKLGKFQCVICMDDCTDLTVTHCGMFTFRSPNIYTLGHS